MNKRENKKRKKKKECMKKLVWKKFYWGNFVLLLCLCWQHCSEIYWKIIVYIYESLSLFWLAKVVYNFLVVKKTIKTNKNALFPHFLFIMFMFNSLTLEARQPTSKNEMSLLIMTYLVTQNKTSKAKMENKFWVCDKILHNFRNAPTKTHVTDYPTALCISEKG